MPKGKTVRAVYDDSKCDMASPCGMTFHGTSKGVILKQKLHLKKCETCRLLGTTLTTEKEFRENLPYKIGHKRKIMATELPYLSKKAVELRKENQYDEKYFKVISNSDLEKVFGK
jgi:hypothetical protein